MNYEHVSEPLLSWPKFLRRFFIHSGFAFLFILFSLGIGMLGYHWTEGMDFTDSFLNASMILTGMGPVQPLSSNTAKIFAGCYAIYSGVAFLSTVAVIFAPVVHRILHKLHLSKKEPSGHKKKHENETENQEI